MISDAIFIMGTLEHCRKTVELQSNVSIIFYPSSHPFFAAEPMFLYVFDHYNPSIMGELAAGMPIQGEKSKCYLIWSIVIFVFDLDCPFVQTQNNLFNQYTYRVLWMRNYINFRYFPCRFNAHMRALLSLQEGSLWKSGTDWDRTKSNGYLLHCHL